MLFSDNNYYYNCNVMDSSSRYLSICSSLRFVHMDRHQDSLDLLLTQLTNLWSCHVKLFNGERETENNKTIKQ